MENILDMTGKVGLVTGARSGIGQACAVTMARQGAKVVLSGRRPCDETEAMIAEFGGQCKFVKCDVSVEEEVKNLVAETVAWGGKLDFAINNAGYNSPTNALCDQTTEDVHKIFEIDVYGIYYCMKYEIPEMLKIADPDNFVMPSIVNIDSVVATVADPGMSPYVAAKHAVLGFTQGACMDYAETGIHINSVGPAFVATEMTIPWLENPEFKEMVRNFNAQKYIADPQDIADVALFLCSRGVRFINGTHIAADGGQTAH